MNSHRDEEMLTRGLRALADEMETLAAPDELETKLLKAFRARSVVTPLARRQWNSRYWLVAVAAMLLIAIGVVISRWNKYSVDTPPRHAGLRRPENTQVANHATSEIATDFIPLSYMNAASLQDGGQIIRVELPRSTLASFGLPVNMDRYNQKVKADVLLGVDGMAHAIRFVQ